MADYSVALGVQPPRIDPSNALALAAQMEQQRFAREQALAGHDLDKQRFAFSQEQEKARLALAQEQAALQRQLTQSQLSDVQGRRNALDEYNKAQQGGDPNALAKLNAYPEQQQSVLQVRSQMDEATRAKFDQGLMRNARRAQYVQGLQGEAKTQAWQASLKEAVDAGDISPQQYQQYSALPPNDLLLQNVIQQAVPVQQLYVTEAARSEPTPAMRELEAAGVAPGTPDYRAAITGGRLLPKFEKVGNKLIKINPDGTTTDMTPAGVAPENAPTGFRWAGNGQDLEFIRGGPADPASKVREEKFSEGASKAANFANMMVQAEQPLKTVTENPIGFFGAVRENLPEGVANIGRSPEYQTYRQAAMQWVRAKLRKESGAAISNPEFEGEFRTYFPQYGDSAEVIEQKNVARAAATRGMIAESRGAYEQLFGGEGPPADLPQTAASPQRSAQPRTPGRIAQPASKAEYDALPPGTPFIDPEGNQRVKP